MTSNAAAMQPEYEVASVAKAAFAGSPEHSVSTNALREAHLLRDGGGHGRQRGHCSAPLYQCTNQHDVFAIRPRPLRNCC